MKYLFSLWLDPQTLLPLARVKVQLERLNNETLRCTVKNILKFVDLIYQQRKAKLQRKATLDFGENVDFFVLRY